MGKIEEPRVILVGVRLEIEQIVDLVGRRHAPPFEKIKNIECRKHSIPVRGDLKQADVKVIRHPTEVFVQGQSCPCPNVVPRRGGVYPTWNVGTRSRHDPLSRIFREPKVPDVFIDCPSSQGARTTLVPWDLRARPRFWDGTMKKFLRGTIRSTSRRRDGFRRLGNTCSSCSVSPTTLYGFFGVYPGWLFPRVISIGPTPTTTSRGFHSGHRGCEDGVRRRWRRNWFDFYRCSK